MGKSVTLDLKGGNRLQAYLAGIASRLSHGGAVNVGFLEKSKYPINAETGAGGLSVAQVAFWNEFGTETAPPRPFFRRMVAEKSKGWGVLMGAAAKATGYRTQETLNMVGGVIRDELRQSINTLKDPPLAESTIRRKGSDKPLVESGWMQKSASFEVVELNK